MVCTEIVNLGIIGTSMLYFVTACLHRISMDITSLALQLAPASAVLDQIKRIPEWPSLTAQSELALMLSSSHMKAFPPPLSNWKYLLKCIEKDILTFVENGSTEDEFFNEDLIEVIVEAQAGQVDSEKSGYLSYKSISFANVYIPIKVKQSHNQVGTKVWGAGVYLGELLQRVPCILANQAVVELGAGVGITGLLIGRALPANFQPSKLVLTDFHFEVVDLLQHNIDINTADGNLQHKCVLESDILDWGTVQPSDYIKYNAKVLLAADCTYSESGNVLLVSAFKCFLETMGDANCDTNKNEIVSGPTSAPIDEKYLRTLSGAGVPYILIACTVRNPATYAHFRGLVDSDGELLVRDATAWAASCFPEETTYYYAEDRSQIDLLCIHHRFY